MKRLRLYLILAILFVGLIPNPGRLLDEHYEGCHSYDSFFINIHWDWRSCAVVSQGIISLRAPGLLTSENSITGEIFPVVYIFVQPSNEANDLQIWGRSLPPHMWGKSGIWEKVSREFQLFPELGIKQPK